MESRGLSGKQLVDRVARVMDVWMYRDKTPDGGMTGRNFTHKLGTFARACQSGCCFYRALLPGRVIQGVVYDMSISQNPQCPSEKSD